MLVEEKPQDKDKIVYVQTVIMQSDLDRLKEKTGKQQTKEALSAAIMKYLEE